jgi:hypothetical protein
MVEVVKFLVPVLPDRRIGIVALFAIILLHGSIEPDQVFYQALRVFEYMVIDALQEKAASTTYIHDKGIVDMAPMKPGDSAGISMDAITLQYIR